MGTWNGVARVGMASEERSDAVELINSNFPISPIIADFTK